MLNILAMRVSNFVIILLLVCSFETVLGSRVWYQHGLTKPSKLQDHKTIANIVLGCLRSFKQPGIIYEAQHGITVSVHNIPVASVILVEIDSSKLDVQDIVETKCNVTARMGCVSFLSYTQHLAIKHMIPGLAKYITSMKLRTPCVVAGYGLGGSLAQLITEELITTYSIFIDSLLLFGSPSVGNKLYSNYLCSKTNCYRYFHPKAVVPLVVNDDAFEFDIGVDHHYDSNNALVMGEPTYEKVRKSCKNSSFIHLQKQIKQSMVHSMTDIRFFGVSKC